MARPPGVDDEYADLQKRFQMLENDRKSLFEHTQLEVKKNKEALAKLKKENKDLRSSLSSLMSDQGKNSGKDSEITKLEQQVSELRRRHDDVKHQCNFRQKELDSMQVRMWGEREGRGMAQLRSTQSPPCHGASATGRSSIPQQPLRALATSCACRVFRSQITVFRGCPLSRRSRYRANRTSC